MNTTRRRVYAHLWPHADNETNTTLKVPAVRFLNILPPNRVSFQIIAVGTLYTHKHIPYTSDTMAL